MKAIMYHYVQRYNYNMPYFNFLDVSEFEKQILYFKNKFDFINKTDFINSIKNCEPIDGVILTFDDGLKCHFKYVLPILIKYDLFGIFYIPTSYFNNDKLINVHRIHYLIGTFDIKILTDYLYEVLPKEFISPEYIHAYDGKTYKTQNLLEEVKYFKQILNYYIKSEYRDDVLDKLMAKFCDNEKQLKSNYYLNINDIKKLHSCGMLVGSHSVNHPVMSKLNEKKQIFEIESSFKDIEMIIGDNKTRTFCYPYGGFHSFNNTTENILNKHSVLFSFNVEARDISKKDLQHNLQKLPRYDCNAFPYGKIFDYSK